MNRKEHLLSIVAEECGEVAQRATKAMRFGLKEIQPGHTQTNAVRLMGEFADLIGVIEMLQAEGHLPPVPEGGPEAKKKQVEHYLKYSKSLGLLDEDDSQ